jgi:hypothetical protein
MLLWKTKKGAPLKPTTLQSLLSALSSGMKVLTGLDASTALRLPARTVRVQLRTHVRKQAVPMTLQKARTLIRNTKGELKCRLALTWALGLRCADSSRLRCSDILQLTREACLLRLRGAKGAIPGSESYFRATPLLGITSCLHTYLAKMSHRSGLLFPSTTKEHMIAAIKKMSRPHVSYSGHSLRRGSCRRLHDKRPPAEYIKIRFRYLAQDS